MIVGFIFLFVQFVVDFFQYFMFEFGDVIFIGILVGFFVIVFGDVVEVEVDVFDVFGVLSLGWLVMIVVQGDMFFDGIIGFFFVVDDLQCMEVWGFCEEVGFFVEELVFVIDFELCVQFFEVLMVGFFVQFCKCGYYFCFIDGVFVNLLGVKIVGVVKILCFVFFCEDFFVSYGGGYNVQKCVFDVVVDGEVIVIEVCGDVMIGMFGDIFVLCVKICGVVGVVIDGGVCDFEVVVEIGLFVFLQGVYFLVFGCKYVLWDVDVMILCGGVIVQFGDIIVGDSDGVIVILLVFVVEVVVVVVVQEIEDVWIVEQVVVGYFVDGLFFMNVEWCVCYEQVMGIGMDMK